MSSVTNLIISAQDRARDVALGRLLGREGCAMFEKELERLSASRTSGWQHVRDAANTYRVSITENLPENVSDLTATVRVTPGVVEVRDHWQYRGRRVAPQPVQEAVRCLVNQTVNRPIVAAVAQGIEQRLRSRLATEVKNRVMATHRVQVYAQVRAGGAR